MLGLHQAIFSLQCHMPWEAITKAVQGLHVHLEWVKPKWPKWPEKKLLEIKAFEGVWKGGAMGRQDFLLTATEQSLVDVTFQMENYRKSSYWFKKKKKAWTLTLKKNITKDLWEHPGYCSFQEIYNVSGFKSVEACQPENSQFRKQDW